MCSCESATVPHCWELLFLKAHRRMYSCHSNPSILMQPCAHAPESSTVEHCRDCILRDTELCPLLLSRKNVQLLLLYLPRTY